MEGKVILSGIQPSGGLTIGNYLGALRSWVKLQDQSENYFLIVDLHALTGPIGPYSLCSRTLDALAIYLSCGLDPDRSTIFAQSSVPYHTELNWYLHPFTTFGELQRMTQFKEKSLAKGSIHLGIFVYPILMAADILLYQTTHVPVGADQTQHLELARHLSERVNNHFEKKIFTLPDQLTSRYGSRIMSLQDPKKKMSKSDPDPKSRIELLDDEETIFLKFKVAVTDSKNEIVYDPQNRPGIANLINIYAALTEQSTDAVVDLFTHQGYSALKKALAQETAAQLSKLQKRFKAFRQDEAQLRKILSDGAAKAKAKALLTIESVREAMGLL